MARSLVIKVSMEFGDEQADLFFVFTGSARDGVNFLLFTAADIALSSAFLSKAAMVSAVTEQHWHSLEAFSPATPCPACTR